MAERPDWIHCIIDKYREDHQKGKHYTSWCGRNIPTNSLGELTEWAFMDVNHALVCITGGNRVQPCGFCVDKIVELLNNYQLGKEQ